jgi:hypothetical protein
MIDPAEYTEFENRVMSLYGRFLQSDAARDALESWAYLHGRKTWAELDAQCERDFNMRASEFVQEHWRKGLANG